MISLSFQKNTRSRVARILSKAGKSPRRRQDASISSVTGRFDRANAVIMSLSRMIACATGFFRRGMFISRCAARGNRLFLCLIIMAGRDRPAMMSGIPFGFREDYSPSLASTPKVRGGLKFA